MAAAGWVAVKDPSGNTYYANPQTGQTSWTPPPGWGAASAPPLPPPVEWWEIYDETYKRSYYFNTVSQERVWEKPTGNVTLVVKTTAPAPPKAVPVPAVVAQPAPPPRLPQPVAPQPAPPPIPAQPAPPPIPAQPQPPPPATPKAVPPPIPAQPQPPPPIPAQPQPPPPSTPKVAPSLPPPLPATSLPPPLPASSLPPPLPASALPPPIPASALPPPIPTTAATPPPIPAAATPVPARPAVNVLPVSAIVDDDGPPPPPPDDLLSFVPPPPPDAEEEYVPAPAPTPKAATPKASPGPMAGGLQLPMAGAAALGLMPGGGGGAGAGGATRRTQSMSPSSNRNSIHADIALAVATPPAGASSPLATATPAATPVAAAPTPTPTPAPVADGPTDNLAPGWEAVFEPNYKQYYYVKRVTGETTWEKPRAAPQAAVASSSDATGEMGAARAAGAKYGGRTRERTKSTSGVEGFFLPAETREEIEKYKLTDFANSQVAVDKTGTLKKRKGRPVPAEQLLRYQKEKLAEPLMASLSKAAKKPAMTAFKSLQTYTGDIKSKNAPMSTVRSWLEGILATPEIIDEVYCHLVKQTNVCPDNEKALKCWELFAVGVRFFKPTDSVRQYLLSYCLRQMDAGHQRVFVTYAAYCLRRLKSLKLEDSIPAASELERMRSEPVAPSVFGGMIEDIMTVELAKNASVTIPRPLRSLTAAIEDKGGFRTEGIFRVPGDVETMNRIREDMQNGNYAIPTMDPNIPACLLKMWFRDLAEPIVPFELFDECIESRSNFAAIVRILERAPPNNYNILEHLIFFLQRMCVREVSAVTKMSVDNLAMVFAPNILRTPEGCKISIFIVSQYQQDFVRTLIDNLRPRADA